MSAPALVGVAVVCMLLGMVIGGSKGFAGLGAFLGFLLGPLGILILACMKPTIAIQAKRAEDLEAARAQLRAQQVPQSEPPSDPWGEAPARRR